MDAFDFIIIGAGSAGCVLANRISADPENRVLLVEAGGSDNNLLVQMPTALSYPMAMQRFNWGYESDPLTAPEVRAWEALLRSTVWYMREAIHMTMMNGQP